MSGLNMIQLLIGCGLRASFPAAVAWAVARLLPCSSAATRHFVWTSAIAIAVLLPLTTIATPRWSVATPAPFAQFASTARVESAASVVQRFDTTSRIEMNTSRRPKGRQPGGLMLWTIAAWVWMMGAALVFCYLLMGRVAAWRIFRTTRRVRGEWVKELEQLIGEAIPGRALRVVESAVVSAPVVLHLWRPVIVIPETAAQWSSARIRAVLLHELAHIKRNDAHTQSVAQLACAIYWFNPLMWFAAYQLRLERERACDDLVLLGGTSGVDYATHLLEIARGSATSASTAFAIGLAEHRSQLEERIIAIVNPKTPRHSPSISGRFIVVFTILLVALAAGGVEVTARAIEVPAGAIKVPASAIQIHADAAELLIGGKQTNGGSVPTGSSVEVNSRSKEFHWAAKMGKREMVEVQLGRGSIRVLPSEDDTVRVQASTDNRSRIQAVPVPNGVKFCDIVTTIRGSLSSCEPDRDASRTEEDQHATEFVIYLPAGVHFAGSTVLGDITAAHPSADYDMATIDGNITLELGVNEGANFNGNLIAGVIDSDFPLNDNTPTLPAGERRAMNAPRIVHTIIGTGGPHLTAMVVNGRIRLLRRLAE